MTETVKAKASNEKIYTYGPLIHNPQAVEALENGYILVTVGKKEGATDAVTP